MGISQAELAYMVQRSNGLAQLDNGCLVLQFQTECVNFPSAQDYECMSDSDILAYQWLFPKGWALIENYSELEQEIHEGLAGLLEVMMLRYVQEYRMRNVNFLTYKQVNLLEGRDGRQLPPYDFDEAWHLLFKEFVEGYEEPEADLILFDQLRMATVLMRIEGYSTAAYENALSVWENVLGAKAMHFHSQADELRVH